MNTIASSYKISQGFFLNEYELKDVPAHRSVLALSRRFYDDAGNLLMASESRHYDCAGISLESKRVR